MPASHPPSSDHFKKIPPAEQERILEICLAEFAEHGYTLASTNTIVKKADIPKGTLFYYFGRKKQLFLYLIDHAVKTYAAEVENKLQHLPDDLFERLLVMHKTRLKFVGQHPLIYKLLFNAFIHTPEALIPELQERIKGYRQQSIDRRTAGLDRTKFKDGVDVEQAVEMVTLLAEGLFNRILGRLQKASPSESLQLVEQLAADMAQYFTYIKQGIYK